MCRVGSTSWVRPVTPSGSGASSTTKGHGRTERRRRERGGRDRHQKPQPWASPGRGDRVKGPERGILRQRCPRTIDCLYTEKPWMGQERNVGRTPYRRSRVGRVTLETQNHCGIFIATTRRTLMGPFFGWKELPASGRLMGPLHAVTRLRAWPGPGYAPLRAMFDSLRRGPALEWTSTIRWFGGGMTGMCSPANLVKSGSGGTPRARLVIYRANGKPSMCV